MGGALAQRSRGMPRNGNGVPIRRKIPTTKSSNHACFSYAFSALGATIWLESAKSHKSFHVEDGRRCLQRELKCDSCLRVSYEDTSRRADCARDCTLLFCQQKR